MKKLSLIAATLTLALISSAKASVYCSASASIGLGTKFYAPVAVFTSAAVSEKLSQGGVLNLAFNEKMLEATPGVVNLDARNVELTAGGSRVLPFFYQLIVLKGKAKSLTVYLEPMPRSSNALMSEPFSVGNGEEVTKAITNLRNPSEKFIIKCSLNKQILTGT